MSIRPLPNELQEKAKIELNEVPSRIQEDLQHIRDWLDKQLHIKAKTDDQTLITFLRNGKFSLQRTKEKLDAFYTMKTLTKEFLKERNPSLPEIQGYLKRGVFAVLFDSSKPLLPVVMIAQWEKVDIENHSMSEMLKLRLMILDILINEYDPVVVNGLLLIEDFKGFPPTFVAQLTPFIAKIFVSAMQDVYPIRIVGAYMVNAPIYFEVIYNVFKQFLKEKIKSRVRIYGSDFSEICQFISPSILPSEYGGEAGSIKMFEAEWKKKIETYSDWYIEDAQYGTDETKRPGKPKTTASMFGIDGSFRKLDID